MANASIPEDQAQLHVKAIKTHVDLHRLGFSETAQGITNGDVRRIKKGSLEAFIAVSNIFKHSFKLGKLCEANPGLEEQVVEMVKTLNKQE